MTNHVSRPSIDDSEAITAARNQINQIDEKLIDLLRQRFQTSALIGKIKERPTYQSLTAGANNRCWKGLSHLIRTPLPKNTYETFLKKS